MAASNDDQLDGDWGKLPAELFNLIAQSLDVTVDVRLAACSKTLCRHVADNMNLHHWDGPCLLMPDSAHWHYDDSSAHHTVYHVVPLDHPRRTAILPFMDNRFWVGMNGDWIAGVDSGGNWFLANIYTHQEISLPSSETCNIFREEWIGFPDLPPERYMTYGRAMFLLKIVICEVPTKAGHYSDYKLIALFNSGLAYLANGSQEWRLFSLASWGVDYSDAIEHNGFIVAVDGWTGTTYCWDQSQAASVPSLAVLSSPLEAPSGSALISLAAAPASPAAPTPTPAARSSPVAAPPKDAMQKQTRSNVNEQLRLRTVDCTCPLHRPEFRIQRNSLAKKPKVTGRRDAAIQRCILKGRGKGRPKRVGHSADPPQPSRFYVQLDGNDDMYMLVIPREFKQCLKGILPRPIKLKTSVGCAWYVHIDEYQGELVLKDGWFGFAEAHELQLDDLLVFEFLTAPSCSELQISPDPSPSISPESSLYTTGVHHRSDYAAWTPSSTDAATSHLKTPLRRRGIPDSLGPWLQWRYVSPESLALPCSNKKLKLGESLSWKETSVEPAPVCKVFGRIDEENTPDSFCKVLCTSELEVISIPSRVLPWFYGGCPESINLKMSTACTWIVDLKQQDGNVLMDKGWPEFVKAHDLKVGYLLTFKKLDTKSLQVLIFGYNCYMASSINFNQFLEKEKLKSNGSNFTDWFRHVRIFLNGGNLQYVLDAPLGDPPAETETDEVKNVYATRKTRYSQVQCAILCSLESDLQKRFEHHDPHELIKELKTIFETHAAVECYEASKHFFSCMMEEGSSISEHMLVMTGHAKKLSDLGIVIPNRLGINRVLQSLPPSYKNFVMNYNMQNMNKEFPELFGMLKAAEIEIKKEHQVLMVNKTTSFKKQGKSKGKFKKGGKKAATPPMKPKNGPKPDAECYYCKEKGHWKRNCSKYLADLKSGLVKKKKEGISDIHVIDVYLTSSRSSTWVFDTGSVAHICNSKQELKNKRQLLKDEVTMRVGNGSKVNVIAVGTLPLHLPSGLVLSLNNCYYVPALSMNIISGSCLMQDGYSFKSENNGCSIFMNNIFYGRAPQKNGLFLLDLDSSNTHIHNIDAKRIKLNDNSTYMWHCRLGHIGVKRMKKLHTDGLLESLDFESLDRCEACLMGKMTKTPFSGMMERATDLLEIIHTDVCGPMSVASRGGYRYVLTFTDDLSRYGYIYLMKHKSETFEKFKEFQSEVENQRNKKIKFLRSDRGGEYLSYEFGMHLKKCGILSQLTPPGTPQRNGVSERRNRTLLDMVRSMMSLTDLPLSFWSYALETAAFTLNRAPSKSVETTPYELWFNKKPKLSFLKVWGCEAYVKRLQPDKLEPKAEKCVFIGYPKETIGYTFYHRSEGKIFVAKNGTFLEKEFLTKEVTGRKVELDEIEESLLVDQSSAVPENVPVPPTPATEEANDNDHETSNETATEPRRSTRDRATPDWYDPCLNVMIVDNNDEDPATYEEAMMSPDSNKWQEAMKSEMGSMYDNKVWTLVELPDSRKAVENKWIFKRKTDADGNITVYKARLVAKGFRQIQGVDYDETFSPVAKLKSVRILLAIAAFFDYEIWQMDVKTAFLNGDIEEELYMVQPKGFVDPKNADKVCKLQRSIYGLKQASRSWNRRFDKVIKDFGFIQCHGEACIYKKVSGSSVAFLILYVDDILLIGNDIELLSSVKGYLNNSFSMKDLGEASYILGIKIYRDRSRRLIGLSQSTYLDKILKKFRMDESKKGFLPMLPGKVLSKTQGPATAEERERMSQIPYASAVGSIMYAMLCTRPDIAHAVSLTSRYQSDPGIEHWTAVKNILKYLKRTKDMFLCYGGDQELVVTSYTDASWNTDPDDSKSQSGYVFILNGAAVSWASSKQCTVAKSSTESEYIAASEASSEAVWMKRFIVELGVVPSALDPLVIYCDNMGAIANAQEPRSHKRLKHIKLRYHSIREYIEDGEVKICKVHTDLNVADPLTKALPRAKHDQHQNAMGVRNHQGRWSPHGTPPPWPANPSGGGVPSGLPLRGPATPPME
ncbi:hypothetical protein QYE76_042133, partial [Lolium multiflorum]